MGATSYKDEFTQLVKIEDLERFVSSFTIMERGYIFVLDDHQKFLIHPELKGMSALALRDSNAGSITKNIIENIGSFFYYRWKNPSEKEGKQKFAYATKLENFNWYIVATGYMEDVTLPIDRVMHLSYTLVVLIAVLLAGLILFFSRSLSRPLEELIGGLRAFHDDKKIFKMQSKSVVEVEAVGHSIEKMTQSLVTSEQEKKDLLEFLDSIINSMPSVLVCIDNKKEIILWNDKATEYSGVSRAKALGRGLMEVFPAFKETLNRMTENVQSQTHHSDTCQIWGDNDENQYFSITLYPLHAGLQSAVVKIDDVTEQMHIKDVLLQSNKMESIGTLAGGIAHDFNNILSGIIGYAELGQMDVPAESPISEYLDKILTAGNRARDLVQQILIFSRQNKRELMPLKIKLIVKEALKLIKASLPSTIEIHGEVESDALIVGDPTQVHQIIMNLCTNAGHAMHKDGGILKVALTNFPPDSDFMSRYPQLRKNPHVRLSVSDTGCGIPPEVMDRIFDPFFTTKALGEGTGMGLAVVHGIVKDFKGIIDVNSEPGKGCRDKETPVETDRRI